MFRNICNLYFVCLTLCRYNTDFEIVTCIIEAYHESLNIHIFSMQPEIIGQSDKIELLEGTRLPETVE